MIERWLETLRHYKTLYVGFSGGLDSVVLLHQLLQYAELAPKVIAIHVHHGLSPHASDWQAHCEVTCQQWQVRCIVAHVDIDKTHNIEEQAREARYQVFKSHLGQTDALLLAHHRDDQVETLLLHLCRGAGVSGLAAMPAMRSFAEGVLIRPLLENDRATLHQYALTHDLQWVEDESNHELRFARNYIRHQVIPILRKRWPNVVNNISECAKQCQIARKNLALLADIDLKSVQNKETFQQNMRELDLSILGLNDQPRVLNVLYTWLQRNQVSLPSATQLQRLLHEVILAADDAQPMLRWGEVCIRRYRNKLYLEKKADLVGQYEKKSWRWENFPKPMVLDGQSMLVAVASEKGTFIPENACIEIRKRQNGERFRLHGQTKTLKKLYQEWGIPPWMRAHIPLFYVNNQLKAIVGYAQADEPNFIEIGKRFVIHIQQTEATLTEINNVETID